MNKQEFTSSYNRIKDEIDNLKTEIENLKSKYIELNKEFEIGQKVLVLPSYGRREWVAAFIASIGVNNNDEIRYTFLKSKKDGTPSKNSLYVWGTPEIKEFENQL